MKKHTTVKITLAAVMASTLAVSAIAQTAEDLKNDAKTTGDVLVYGMGYGANRFSSLKQINKDNVHKLVPKWAFSLTDNRGGEAMPLFKDGVLYTTVHNATIAVNAMTGRQIWRTNHDYPPATLRVVCCGIVNRGAAIYEGMIIRALMDDRVIALDAKTGKKVWETKAPAPATPKNGYSMTGAPLIANGVVIVGVAGAEYSIRGFLDGYDAKTGKHLWRTYTIPKKGEKGYETWPAGKAEVGGGSTWVTGTYDPELDLVFWGTGNPTPWNPVSRPGDNLFTDSILAFSPKTGKVKWHYQATPNDPFDYDGVHQPVLTNLKVDGKDTRVVMQANRNGFFYVLNAASGKLLAANKFGKVNWATHVDLKTGRPVVTDVYKDVMKGKKVSAWPSVSGVTNWMHMSFNPGTGLAYVNTIHMGNTYEPRKPKVLKPGQPSGPGTVKRTPLFDNPNERGYLKAINPMTGKIKWTAPFKSPNYGSTMTTAGGLVFTGVMTGEFEAYDADNGKKLWSFQTSSGILGQPITWEMDGKQYVTVLVGIGGVYALRVGDPNLKNVPAGASLWTFQLYEEKK
ncbi:MAG: PQQ-dependent dehydrogenase, methanol/ethanol family [Hyphomicrobiales bacterium]|nr:PQQ-dependent dehydrogenase, methanol/ethanol family [Hyphomicrobiales bacterium]